MQVNIKGPNVTFEEHPENSLEEFYNAKRKEGIPIEEVSKHNKYGKDAWTIIKGNVYNITNVDIKDDKTGLKNIFENYAGKDSTGQFFRSLDNPFKKLTEMEKFKIGKLSTPLKNEVHVSDKGFYMEEIDPSKSEMALKNLEKRRTWDTYLGFVIGGVSVITVYSITKFAINRIKEN